MYGYFLDKRQSQFRDLFEYQQASAEGTTERLASLLFAPVSELIARPDRIKNDVRVTRKYLENLVQSFEEKEAVATREEKQSAAAAAAASAAAAAGTAARSPSRSDSKTNKGGRRKLFGRK